MKGAYKRGNRWVSSLRMNGRTVSLGSFNTELQAHQAYKAARESNPAYNNSGINHPLVVLTEEQVASIRADVGTVKAIAERHGVSAPHVWRIRAGQARKEG